MRIKEGKFSVYEIDPMYLEYLSKYDKNVRKKAKKHGFFSRVKGKVLNNRRKKGRKTLSK